MKGGFQNQVISYSVGVEDESKHPSSPKELPIDGESRRNLLIVSIIAFGLLGVAFVLTPAKGGIGTHQQLGLPVCGWVLAADLPCPTCGMTTAWSHTVRGQWITAFLTQPMGFLLALSTAYVGLLSLLAACTGRAYQLYYYRFANSKFFILVIGLAIVAWGFKILTHRGIL